MSRKKGEPFTLRTVKNEIGTVRYYRTLKQTSELERAFLFGAEFALDWAYNHNRSSGPAGYIRWLHDQPFKDTQLGGVLKEGEDA